MFFRRKLVIFYALIFMFSVETYTENFKFFNYGSVLAESDDDVGELDDDPFDDEDQEAHDVNVWDPLESFNRSIFWFNNTLDVNIVEPWARYYDEVTPEPAQQSIRNFFINLQYPRYLVSDIITLDFTDAWTHTVRFTLNSTLGFFGIFDVAKEYGYKHKPNDIGLTLQKLGVPAGPYIVLPLLGPSNLRDVFGTVADTALDPIFWASYTDYLEETEELLALGSLKSWELMQRRTDALEAIAAGKRSSVDFYLFAQAAYYQYREGMIKNNMSQKELEKSGADEDWFKDE
jgi:phospholipid-binding lipoprotein MlaA